MKHILDAAADAAASLADRLAVRGEPLVLGSEEAGEIRLLVAIGTSGLTENDVDAWRLGALRGAPLRSARADAVVAVADYARERVTGKVVSP